MKTYIIRGYEFHVIPNYQHTTGEIIAMVCAIVLLLSIVLFFAGLKHCEYFKKLG